LSKLFLLLAVFALLYWVLKANKKNRQARRSRRHPEDMVRCAECGVHLPRSESIKVGQIFYCSAEHQAQRQHND
jgi:uncharacterized protein